MAERARNIAARERRPWSLFKVFWRRATSRPPRNLTQVAATPGRIAGEPRRNGLGPTTEPLRFDMPSDDPAEQSIPVTAASPRWKRRLAGLEQWLDRLPWLLPLVSFAAGWLSFVLVQRGADVARLFALIALLALPWLLIEPLLRRWVERRHGRRFARLAMNFVTQSLQQELLFFSLPFLFGAAERDLGQWLFIALAALAALLSTLDPIYHRLVARRPARRIAFHAWCSWIAAVVLLPLVVKLPLERALPVAFAAVGGWLLLTLPLLLRSLPDGRRRLLWSAGLVVVPLLLWSARAHVPAAGLSVTDARITQRIEQLQPDVAVRTLGADQLQNGVVAFVAIRAPMGASQDVVFEWRHRGEVERIGAKIRGGRQQGFRTYSRKHRFPADSLGHWTVDVRTAQGQLLKRLHFEVVAPARPALPPQLP